MLDEDGGVGAEEIARGRPGDRSRNVGPPGGEENGDTPEKGLGARSGCTAPVPVLRILPNFANHRGTSMLPSHDG